ncbi:MAG: aminoacyl-tRNA hydrolase [Fimbriimonadales bacterium]
MLSQSRPERLIVGLGNPGEEYAGTRHNAGFWVVSLLARRHAIPLKTLRHHSKYGIGAIQGVPVLLALPMTYMNRSGDAVRALLKAYHLTPQQMLVVYDDVALPLGTLRVRADGSAGGQKGMKSIIQALGTEAFPRLRIGVGPAPQGCDLADFVLSPFDESERPLARQMMELGADAAEAWLTQPIEQVMAQFNRRFSTDAS